MKFISTPRILVITLLSILFSSSAFAQCAAPTGLAVSDIGTDGATFSWNFVSGETYNLVITSTIDGSTQNYYPGGNSIIVNSLAPSLNFTWTLQAVCSNNSTSTIVSGPGFTTLACNPPAGGTTTNITTTSATLSWNSTVSGGSFYVQIAPENTGTFTYLGAVGDTFINVTGLDQATAYEWEVATQCDGATSTYGNQVYFSTNYGCTAPASATSSNITNYSATLTWNSVPGATSYSYEYIDNEYCYSIYCECYDVCNYLSYGPYTTTDTSVTVKNLNPPSTPYDFYTWQVQTNCAAGTSTFVGGGFTVQSPCNEPVPQTATNITATTATLNWEAALGATSYNYQYSVNGTTWLTGSTTGTSAVITGLSPATAYEWEVQTNCSSGTSTFYSIANFTTLGQPCSTPAGTATGTLTGSTAVLTWNADSGTSSYIVRYEVTGGTTWTSATATTNSYTLTGLTPGQNYAWEVAAVCNGGGTSAFSASTDFTTLCSQPANLTTKYVTNNSATFSWAAVPGVTNYTVEYYVEGSNTSITVTTSADSIDVTGLSSSTLYLWAVESLCANGNSGYTGSEFSTTCGYPISNSAVPTNNSAVLTWSAVTGATSYNIEYKLSTASTYTSLGSTTGTSYNLTGLNANTQYDFEVQSVCSLGTSAWNIIAFDTYEFPAPTGLTTTNITSSTATLKWTPVSGATGYEVYISGFGSYYLSATTDSVNVTGLQLGYQYSWSVQVSFPGTSAFSNPAYFYPLCAQPTGLGNTDISYTSAEFTWTSLSGVGSDNFRYKPVGASAWRVVEGAGWDFWTVDTLYPGTEYEWELQSVCGGEDTSAYTGPVYFTTNCVIPVPSNATNITSSSAQLWWTYNNAGPNYDSTKVFYGLTTSNNVQSVTVAGDSVVVSGLQPATSYYFKVSGRCSGDTTYSNGTLDFTTLAACNAPTGMSTTNITSTTATFKWAAVSGASSYVVQYMVDGGNTWTSATATVDSFLATGLMAGTNYEWEVQTVCSAGGSSGFSSTSTFSTPCIAPEGLTVSNDTLTSVKLSWQPVSGVSRYVVEYYANINGAGTAVYDTTTADSITLTGLTQNTVYSWWVASLCQSTLAWSARSGFGTACSPPTVLYAAYITDTSAQVFWNEYEYESLIQYRQSGTTTWLPGVNDGDYGYIGSLTANTTYEWQVGFFCANEVTVWSASSFFTTTGGNCAAPTGLVVKKPDLYNAWLYWNPVPGAIGYSVEYNTGGVNLNEGFTTADSLYINGLFSNAYYVWTVQAVFANCTSAPTATYSFYTFPCPEVTGMNTQNITQNSATLDWDDTTFGPYGFTAAYNIQYRQVGTTTWTVLDSELTSGVTITGLTPATEYEWQVTTDCNSAQSTSTLSTDFTTLTASCAQPQNLNVFNVSGNAGTLTWWSASGAISTNYRYRQIGTTAWTTGNTTSENVDIAGLLPNTEYEYQLQSVCGGGGDTSAYTASFDFETSGCLTPYNLTTTDITSSTAIINWLPASNEGFEYQIMTVDSTNWIYGGSNYEGNAAFVTGLAPNTTYVWEVYSVCIQGYEYTPNSAPAYFTTTDTCAIGLRYEFDPLSLTSVELSWTLSPGALYYNVYYWNSDNQNSGAANVTTLSTTSNHVYISGLSPDSSYLWRVETVCSAGVISTGIYEFSSSYFSTNCSPPGGETVTPSSNTSVQLSWNNVPGNTGYLVRYMTEYQSTWTTIPTGTNLDSIIVLDLEPGTIYEWQVITDCSGTTSTFNSPIYTFVTGGCNIPTGTNTTSITTNGATLNWTAAVGASSYTYQYRPTGTSNWTQGSTSSNTANISGLNTSTQYEWQVETNCSGGTSTFTASTDFTTLAAACNAPTGMSTTNITSTTATFKWAAVSGATGYNIQYKVTGGSTWTSATTSVDSFNVTGLTDGTGYEWEVQTVCSGGSSAFTSAANFTTACPIPTGMTTGVYTTYVEFSWTAVTGALSYNYQYRIIGITTWTSGSTTNAYVEFTSLANGTSYEWQVQTVCTSGTSAFSASTDFTTICGQYGGYITSNVSSITETSVFISWASGYSSYNLQYQVEGATTWTTINTSNTSISLTGLIPGQNYVYQLQGVCPVGETAYEGPYNFSTACNGPTNENNVSTGNTSETLEWTPDPGAVSYTIQYALASNLVWTTISTNADTLALTGLLSGATYDWEINSVCAGGNASSVPYFQFNTPCNPPTGLTVENLTSSSVTLKWATESGATEYEVQYLVQGAANWTTIISTIDSVNLTGLSGGTTYEWEVVTACNEGTSTFTGGGSFNTLPTCNTPTGEATSNVTSSSATFKWSPVSGVTGYNFQYMEVGGEFWTSVTTSADSINLTQLQPGTSFEWEVQSICPGGGYSAFSSPVIFATSCPVPTGMSTTGITSSAAEFTWTTIAGAPAYTVQYRVVGTTTWTSGVVTSDQFPVTGLQAGTTYEWQVSTICAGGTSTFSAVTDFTTLPAGCTTPTGPSTTNITSSSATFKWAAVSGATGYNIQYMPVGQTTWTTVTATTDSINVTGLNSADSYEWEVQTVCSGGSSAFTSPITFVTLCNAPTGMTVTNIGSNSVTLKWIPVQNSSGYYNVSYATLSGGPATTITEIGADSIVITGLTGGTTYEWYVQTACPGGNSAYVEGPDFTTISCGVPSGLSYDNLTPTSATLSWSPVTGAIGYNVQYMLLIGDTGWKTVTTNTDSVTVTGLTPGTVNYEWEVSTICSSGTSTFSNFSIFWTPCDAPTGTTTTHITSTSATFNWAPIDFDYIIQYMVVGGTTWTSAEAGTDSFNVSGLTPGTNYEWEVEIVCGSGPSFSPPTYFTTTGGTCNMATGMSTANITSSSATFKWAAVSGATGYNIQYMVVGGSTWTTATSSTDSFNVRGLSASTNYVWQVQTVCSDGNSAFTASTAFSTPAVTVTYCTSTGTTTAFEYISNVTLGSIDNTTGNDGGYANFTNLSTNLVSGSSNTISLTPGFTGSRYDEFFTVYIDYNHDGSFTDAGDLVLEVNGSSTVSGSFTVPTTAVLGSTRMRIQMQYGSYETNPCATYTFGEVEDYTVDIVSANTCNTPTGLFSSNVGSTSATLKWAPVSGATSYNIQYGVGGSPWTSVTSTVDSVNIYDLFNPSTYEWEVQTVCPSGNSAYSSASEFTTLCNSPSGLNTTGITDSSAILSWSLVPGGEGAFNFRYRVLNTSVWYNLTAYAGEYSGSYPLSGLAAATTYEWQVATVCSAGSSTFTASADFTTLGSSCNTPTGITTSNITSGSATFKWNPVTGAGNYVVYYMPAGATGWTVGSISADSFTASGLMAATGYQWKVQTVCAAQDSSVVSGATSFTTPGTCVTFRHGTGARMSSYYPANNYNLTSFPTFDAMQWTDQGTPIEDRSMIEFNLAQIPAGSVIVSASFNLYADSAEGSYVGEPTYYSGSGNASNLELITSAWSPSTVTWNTQPSITATNEVALPTSTNYDENYLNLNLTGLAQSWVNDPSANYGMMLKMVNPDYYNEMIFFSPSATDSTKWPALNVCYTAATCAIPTGTNTTGITSSTATFKWLPVAGAGSYNVQYMPVGGASWTSATTSADSLNVTGLTANTSYQWQVQTVCSSSGSGFTAANTFSTTGSCGVPAAQYILNTTASSATLAWYSVPNAISYTEQWRLQGATTWSSASVTDTFYNLTGLTPGSIYQWQMQTVCSGGTSPFTPIATFGTLCTPATGLTVSNITSSSAHLSWTAIEFVNSYDIQYSINGSNNWTTVSSPTDSITITGLTPSTTYQWQVQGECNGGSSTYAAGANFTTTGNGCNTATGTSTTNITGSSATFKWAPVSGATGYNIQYMVAGGASWTTATTTADSFNVTGLAAGTNYEWEVQTVCSSGNSTFTSATGFTTSGIATTYCTSTGEYTTFEYIKNVTLGSIDNTTGDVGGYANYTNLSTNLAIGSNYTISLTPGFNYGAAQEFFTVYIDYGHDGLFTDAGDLVLEVNTSSSVTGSFTVPGNAVTGPTRMRIQMQYGSYETNPCADYTFGEVADYTVNITGTSSCNAPSGLSASNITGSSATLKWNATSGAISYNVQYMKAGGSNWTSATTSADSFNATGLAPSTSYEWAVQTNCAAGSSTFTSIASFTTLAPCNIPTDQDVTNFNYTSVTLSWATVPGATGYNYQYQVVGANSWIMGSTSSTSVTISGLSSGTDYYWQVQTVCPAGTSAFTYLTGFITPSPSCGTPTGISTVNITSSSAELKWTPGANSTLYYVDYKEVGTSTWSTTTTNADSVTITGLIPATGYEWTVESDCGNNLYSLVTTPTDFTTLPATGCSTPTGLSTSDITASQATFKWTPVAGASSYNIQYMVNGGSSWTTGTTTADSFNADGLASASAYVWQVQAVCSDGNSLFTSSTGFNTTTLTYCASEGEYTTFEYIENVTLGSIDNTTGNTGGYANYTNLSTDLTGGSAYTISLTPGFNFGADLEFFTVYIDYNQNGLFTDPGERVLEVYGSATVSGSFTVPITALNGPTRMRIQMQYGSYETNPCATYTFGEVEDYTVIISGNAKELDQVNNGDGYPALEDIKLYPNPAQSVLNVQFNSNTAGTVWLNVYSIAGQRVLGRESAYVTGVNTRSIDVSTLSDGIYILEAESQGIIQRQKFVVTR